MRAWPDPDQTSVHFASAPHRLYSVPSLDNYVSFLFFLFRCDAPFLSHVNRLSHRICVRRRPFPFSQSGRPNTLFCIATLLPEVEVRNPACMVSISIRAFNANLDSVSDRMKVLSKRPLSFLSLPNALALGRFTCHCIYHPLGNIEELLQFPHERPIT